MITRIGQGCLTGSAGIEKANCRPPFSAKSGAVVFRPFKGETSSSLRPSSFKSTNCIRWVVGSSADRMIRPGLVGSWSLTNPPNGSARGGVVGLPIAADCKVQSPVAVDIVRSEADVIEFRSWFRKHDVLIPLRVFQPQEPFTIHHGDIQAFVAVHVNQPNCISDLQSRAQLLITQAQFPLHLLSFQ